MNQHRTTTISAINPAPRFQWPVVLLLWILSLLPLNAWADSLPALSVSVLQFGTAHWELDHILHRQLDREHGYRLQLNLVANLPASRLAVTSGSVNGAVADLLWAQSRFRDGEPYLYVPFSSQIGDIVVAEDSAVHSISDLAGKRIGVAGGPDSKGWMLLMRVARERGINLSEASDIQFAAPPLLNQALKRGQLDVIVTYWHFAARLKGEGGWRSAFGMADLLAELNLVRNLPVLGYVFPAHWAQNHRELIDRFAASIRQAKADLAEDVSNWQRLRAVMGSPANGVFDALREGFVTGAPAPLTDQHIADLQQLMALTGDAPGDPMPVSLFYRVQQ